MNETLSGVSAGVVPNTVAPGSAVASMPWPTGAMLGPTGAVAPDAEASGPAMASAPHPAPISRRRPAETIMIGNAVLGPGGTDDRRPDPATDRWRWPLTLPGGSIGIQPTPAA